MRRTTALIAAAIAPVIITGVGCSSPKQHPVHPGVDKIKHVVVIMQENRSFDSYFGTYPGADGLPMDNGVPRTCLPARAGKRCLRPYHDLFDINRGGPHDAIASAGDVNGGAMDGF